MDNIQRQKIIDCSWQLHNTIEKSYLSDKTKKGDENWLEKQRLLLADMALHLLQTSLAVGVIDQQRLAENIHAVLTVSDQFLPEAKLKKALQNL